MKTVTKRILAVLLSVTVLVSYLLMPAEQTQTFAADSVLHSLNLWTSTGGHGSGSMTVWKNASTSVSAPQVIYAWFGDPADSYSLFCIDYGKAASTGNSYATSTDYAKLNSDQQKYIGYVLGCAQRVQAPRYNGSFNDYGGDVTFENWKLYNSTQLMIWYYIDKYYTPGMNEGIGWDGVVKTCEAGWGNLAECERIKSVVDSLYDIPSFVSNIGSTAPTYKLTYNPSTGKYETILQDTNATCMIGKFSWSGSGLTFTRCNASGVADANGTYLKISSDTTIASGSAVVTTNQYVASTGNITYVKNTSAAQDLVLCNSSRPDPVRAYMNVYTESALQISKKEITGENELPGATLKLTNAAGQTVDTWVSGTSPHVIHNLASGSYTLTETIAPDKHVLAQAIQFTYDADAGTTQTITMRDDFTTVRLKKEDADGNPVLGATMKLYNSAGQVVDTWVSDGTEHVVKGLPFGTYTWVEESAPDGWTIADPVTVQVTMNGPANKTMVERETKVQFLKQDADGNPLAGAKLELYDSDDNLIDSWTSTTTPYTITNLSHGEYRLHETKAPSGHVLAEDKVFSVTDRNETVSVVMQDKETRVQFLKQDEEGNPLAGAKLELYDSDDNLIDSWTSADDYYVIKNLPHGEYRLHEAEAPEGWTLADDVEFTVTDKPEPVIVKMSDRRIYGNFKLVKTSLQIPDKRLPGATFSLYRTFEDSEIPDEYLGDYTTDENGEIFIENLVYGRYYLKEIEANEHYYLNTELCKFEIREDGETVTADYINTAIVGVLHVRYENKFRRGQLVAGTPMTGDIQYPEFAIAVLVMMLAIALKLFIVKQKR